MKTKPVSHKNENTFRFSSFGERLNKISIDVIHRVGKTSVNPADANSFFQEAIDKWNDLNYTEDYDALRKDIGHEILTLSQIIYRKEELIDILLRHFQNVENMALDAALEFTVALSRDLQMDFYPYFPKFFVALTRLLETRDTVLLERIFMSLSYLFKFLWRYMLKDMKNVYRLYSSLLTLDNKEHIRNFAAESFAFLIRKVPEKPKFFCFVFHQLRSHPEQAEGLGQLFFEVIKGVGKHFQSCTELILKSLFKCLGNGCDSEFETETRDMPYSLVEESLQQMLQSMQRYTCKGKADVIENVFSATLKELFENVNSGKITTEVFADHCGRLLRLLHSWIEYQDAWLLSEKAPIIQVLSQFGGLENMPDSCLESMIDITVVLLLSKNLVVPISCINSLLDHIFKSKKAKLIFQFVKRMFDYGMFQKDLLPRLLPYCLDIARTSETISNQVLEVISETVLSLNPVNQSLEGIKVFAKMPLYIPERESTAEYITLESLFLDVLKKEEFSSETFSDVYYCLVCLPHFKTLDVTLALESVAAVTKKCVTFIESCSMDSENKLDMCRYVLCESFVCWLCLGGELHSSTLFTTTFFVDITKKFPSCVSILRMLSIYFNHSDMTAILSKDSDIMCILLSALVQNLASPFHQVRLLTLELLCLLPFTLPANEDGVKEDLNVFHLCHQAEKILPNVEGYREKLKWMRKLDHDSVKKHLPVEYSDIVMKAPLYFLLGSLYINFSLLWKPTMELISSHAEDGNKHFWEVFKSYLHKITDNAENFGSSPESAHLNESTEAEQESVFSTSYKRLCESIENPDVMNHRLLLWKNMMQFISLVRQKHEDIVPLVFRFVEREVVRMEDSFATSEVVTSNETIGDLSLDNTLDNEEANDSDVSEEEDESSAVPRKKRKLLETNPEDSQSFPMESHALLNAVADTRFPNAESGRKRKKSKAPVYKKQHSVLKTLSAILNLFSKFKKPGSLFRAAELQRLYYELLMHHDSEIQKLSLDCVMTYQFDFLIPYKENFYRLIDDKTFKTEIVLFSVDKDNQVIQESHRKEALFALMRILYGKMLRKAGNNTSGKAQSHLRKTLVLRFLAGCHAAELKMFFDLVFEPLKDHLHDDTLTAVRNIRNNTDISAIVPLRKLRSILSTLEVILHNLGSLAPELLPLFLKVVLVVATMSSTLSEKRHELLSHCVTLVKFIRKQATMTLIQFFKCFEHYNFSTKEIDAIFEAVVWPMLPRLEFEALNQPPPLLRLLDTWCNNSRYFPLLSKHHSSSKQLSPIPRLMSLYNSESIRPRVVGLVSKMIHSLLTTTDYICDPDAEGKGLPLEVNDCLVSYPEKDVEKPEDGPTHGVLLLLPYVSDILKRLQAVVHKASKSPKRSLESRELTILLRLSSFIEESGKCHNLIELLVPFFTRQKKLRGDCEVLVLSTIKNLMPRVENPKHFVKLFAPFFGSLSSQRSRLSLVSIFSTMALKNPELEKTAEIVGKINAWNPNFMEEPDFQTRLDGHSAALKVIDGMTTEIDGDFVQIIIFNSAFMIRTCDDLSLRDSTSFLLQELTKRFPGFMESNPDLFRIFAFETLLPEIKKGLRSKVEIVRSESIRVLSALLHNCGTHARLVHLAQLCNEDLDMDFWANILHMQVHRRARALLKFATKLSAEEIDMPQHILVTYIIPIVSSFFFDSAYSKHVHVIDAAIETLGAIAKKLDWSYYESNLRHYLNLLSKDAEHHKVIVKIVVSLLDAFHFDLSASQWSRFNKKEFLKKQTKTPDEDLPEKPIADDTVDAKMDTEEMEENATKVNDVPDEEKATKIHRAIAKGILPQLNKSLMHKTKSDDEHKLAGPHYAEDEEVLRVPIALAIVKLLQNLPNDSLKRNISGLFLKMCHLLKSRAESIRETARDTLVKMMQSLGPRYFGHLVHEMRAVMKKGYQVHVMSFTVNSILQNLKSQLKYGDLDSAVSDLTQICMNELFGETAEEKEVSKITGKLKEARSNKSYSIYEILSQFISEDCLGELISPLKETLSTARSHKAVKKIHECLRHIAIGISEDAGISAKELLIFTYTLISEHLPLMNPKSSSEVKSESKFVRPDIYLIPKEPGRGGPPAKTSGKTNAHVFVDFSLQLLHLCLKRDKLKPTEREHLEMLDPFIPILTASLDSNHIKIISTALRCLLWLFKFPLPTLQTSSTHIVNASFVLLNKYAGVGMGQGENFEMVVMCFKMLTVIVRDTNYHKLSEDQLRVLLSYIDQDINDYTRQATAFTLLKAVLSKKLEAAELPAIMDKISEMAITSEQGHIRTQSRQVSLQYLANYPLGKNLKQSLGFYVNQLEYPHEHGRVSAIEMINSLLHSFDPIVIKKHSGLFFVPLSARLVNDDASRCRKMVSVTLKSLLKKVDHDGRTALFSIVSTWMEDRKTPLRRLGAQLCGIFAEVEGQDFERFLKDAFPLFSRQLEEAESLQAENQTDERCKDHFLYHLLNALAKVLSYCKIIRREEFALEMSTIWEHLQRLILYPHLWVRLASSQLFGLLFASYTAEEVVDAVTDGSTSEEGSIFFAKRQKLRDLSADFVTQLQSPYLTEELGEQVIRNLVYLAKVISKLPAIAPRKETDEQNEANATTEVTLSWMIRKLCREVKKEVAFSPQNSIKRKSIFKFLAAIAIDIEKDILYVLLPDIFIPLCREVTDESLQSDESLKSLTREVLDIFKNVLGVEEFTKVYSVIQSSLVRKKVKRKQDRAKEAVTNPESFAKKKIKKQLNKKEAKKRKILVQKGKRKTKKTKLSQLAIQS